MTNVLKIKIVRGEHAGDICDVVGSYGGNGHGATHYTVINQNGETYNFKKKKGKYQIIKAIDEEEVARIKNETREKNKVYDLACQLRELGRLYDAVKKENEKLKAQIEKLEKSMK